MINKNTVGTLKDHNYGSPLYQHDPKKESE